MATFVISLALAVLLGLVIRKLIRDRKKGTGCGSCAGCAMSDACHPRQEQ